MYHKRYRLRGLTLLGLALGVLIPTAVMLSFVQAQGLASVSIVKEADQAVVAGSDATFTIAIANTGDVTLTSVTVSDALASDCDRVLGSLPAGASTDYVCTAANVVNSFTNSATVIGTLEEGGDVSDTDTAVVTVIHPAIEMVKTADPTVVNVGDTVDYTITVENTGDSDLDNVIVDDDLAGCALSGPDGDTHNLGVLDTDETWEYTCSVTAGSEDIVNTATVHTTDAAGGTVSDFDAAGVTVIHSDIEIAKTAYPLVVGIGDTVNYTITVENTGDSDLYDVIVDDHLEGCTLAGPDGDIDNLGVLDLDETWEYTCSVIAGSGDIENTATVEATDEAGGTVVDSAHAEVDVAHPDIEIAKTPEMQTVSRNSTVTFTIAVTNTGDVSLVAVTVSDTQAPNCNADVGPLAVDETASYECTLADVTDGFINSATVTGRPSAGETVTASDAAKVTLEETLICPTDMIAYWRLDEDGATSYDDYYDGHDGGCADHCPTPTAGKVDGGQAFNGNNTGIDVLAVPGDDSFNWASHDSFSVEFWMKADSADSCSLGNEVIIGRDDGTDSSLHWWAGIGCWAGGKAAFVLRDKNGDISSLVGTTDVTDGAWYHVVAVRDGGLNENRIYVNGAEEASESVFYSAGFDSPTATLNIGWLNLAHGFHYDGTLDEVATYARSLSAAEVRQHYNEGLAGRWHCEPGMFSPVIVSTPVTEATAGRPFIYDVEAVGDPAPTYTLVISPSGMSIAPSSGLISWTPTIAQDGPHDVEVVAINSEGTYTQSFTIVVSEGTLCPANMVAYWRLDETGGSTYDDFYDGHDGTCGLQCPAPATGHINGGQTFDGVNTQVNVVADEEFDWGADDSFTIEFWLRTDSAHTCAGNEVVISRDDSSTNLHWWVGCRTGGAAAFFLIDTNGGEASVIGTAGSLTDGDWHHVVAVRDASANQIRIYVDGTGQGSTPATYSYGFESSTAPLSIGWLDLADGFHFEGVLDEVAVYSRALSAGEIDEHYNDRQAGPGYCIYPDIAVEKTADPKVVYPWDGLVTYTYTVTNPGNAPLSAISLSDDKCSAVSFLGGDDGDDQLDPIEAWIYRCSATLDADTTNTATVEGTYSLDGTVSDRDVFFVDVISPEIAIDKVADPTYVHAGDAVTYTYTVTNTGDDLLREVKVSDDKCSPVDFVEGDDNGNYVFDPGETWAYICSTALSMDTTNTGSVTGTDSAGGTVSATDTAFVDVEESTSVYLPLVLKH